MLHKGETAMKIMLGVCSVFIALVLADAPAAFAHWPDQVPHQIAQLGEFKLEGGGVLEDLKMSFVTHGKLNAAKDNAILFQHGFALNHHQFDHMIGPGRPLDTDKYLHHLPGCAGRNANSLRAFEQPHQQRAQDEVPVLQQTRYGQSAVHANNSNAGHFTSPCCHRDLVWR